MAEVRIHVEDKGVVTGYLKSISGFALLLNVRNTVIQYYKKKGLPVHLKIGHINMIEVFTAIKWLRDDSGIKVRQSFEPIYERLRHEIMNEWRDNNRIREGMLLLLDKLIKGDKKAMKARRELGLKNG